MILLYTLLLPPGYPLLHSLRAAHRSAHSHAHPRYSSMPISPPCVPCMAGCSAISSSSSDPRPAPPHRARQMHGKSIAYRQRGPNVWRRREKPRVASGSRWWALCWRYLGWGAGHRRVRKGNFRDLNRISGAGKQVGCSVPYFEALRRLPATNARSAQIRDGDMVHAHLNGERRRVVAVSRHGCKT